MSPLHASRNKTLNKLETKYKPQLSPCRNLELVMYLGNRPIAPDEAGGSPGHVLSLVPEIMCCFAQKC